MALVSADLLSYCKNTAIAVFLQVLHGYDFEGIERSNPYGVRLDAECSTSEWGELQFNLAVQLGIWAELDGTGLGFDSSAGFTLPNGATRSPDASWIKTERWNALSEEEKASFAPICPDFVIELRSASDTLSSLKMKMQEYIVFLFEM